MPSHEATVSPSDSCTACFVLLRRPKESTEPPVDTLPSGPLLCRTLGSVLVLMGTLSSPRFHRVAATLASVTPHFHHHRGNPDVHTCKMRNQDQRIQTCPWWLALNHIVLIGGSNYSLCRL